MLSQPLPNDLLRNPPWPETIISWPINETFLAFINESERMLRECGYYLKYGVEVNLGILSPTEAITLRKKQSSLLSWWRRACREQFARDLVGADLNAVFPRAAAAIYSQLQDIAEQQRRIPKPDSDEWLTNWGKTQEFYRVATQAIETPGTVLAKKDFM